MLEQRIEYLYFYTLFLPKPQQSVVYKCSIFSDGCFLASAVLELFENVACTMGLPTHVSVPPSTKAPRSLTEDFKICIQKLY